jgi:tRNA A-37 threonylcarbamoyl transferase component Bud32
MIVARQDKEFSPMGLDIENFDALRDYLTARGDLMPREEVLIEKLPGGVSNRTVRVKWTEERGWVLKQALSKLRVNIDWFSRPERIRIEAKALRWLNRSAPSGSTPVFIFEDLENHLLAMSAIPKEHANWKTLLLSGKIEADHFRQFGFLLATIHHKSSESWPEVSREFADTSYFENLRLEPYYLYTAQIISPASEFLNELAWETLQHKHSLVHGDFSPKNMLVYQNKLILLDYEVVHFGDPAFDAGFAMTHFLSKAHHLPQHRSRFTRFAKLFWQAYYKEIAPLNWADTLEPRVVRHTLGCLLARVAGKSPLEYLTPEERERQLHVVLALLLKTPASVTELISEFVHRIDTYAKN